MESNRTEELTRIAKCVTDMVWPYAHVEITYRKETDESLNDYTEWGRQRFGLMAGGEYFFVWRGQLLYVVCVNADSVLTAAHELMALIAKKF